MASAVGAFFVPKIKPHCLAAVGLLSFLAYFKRSSTTAGMAGMPRATYRRGRSW